jgi:hypothetical protein
MKDGHCLRMSCTTSTAFVRPSVGLCSSSLPVEHAFWSSHMLNFVPCHRQAGQVYVLLVQQLQLQHTAGFNSGQG